MISIVEQRELWKLIREYADAHAYVAVARVNIRPTLAQEKRRFAAAQSKLASFITKHTEKSAND